MEAAGTYGTSKWWEALLVNNNANYKKSLVVIRKGENIWEERTLACFGDRDIFLASDKDWLSVTKWSLKRATLWQDDNYRQDIDLPGCLPSNRLMATAMDLPFFILCLKVERGTYIKVFRLAADKEMENISTVASIVKSISIGDVVMPIWKEVICNQLFFGVVVRRCLDGGAAVALIEKRTLVDAEPEKRIFNMVAKPTLGCVDMNSTSLVFARDDVWIQNDEVLKHDFWMAV